MQLTAQRRSCAGIPSSEAETSELLRRSAFHVDQPAQHTEQALALMRLGLPEVPLLPRIARAMEEEVLLRAWMRIDRDLPLRIGGTRDEAILAGGNRKAP